MGGFTSAYSAGMRARSKVYLGVVNVTMLVFDPTQGGMAGVGNVKSFEFETPSLSGGSAQINLRVGEDNVATAEKLRECQFSVDGQLYKVLHRAEPIGYNKRIWRFRLENQGSGNDVY